MSDIHQFRSLLALLTLQFSCPLSLSNPWRHCHHTAITAPLTTTKSPIRPTWLVGAWIPLFLKPSSFARTRRTSRRSKRESKFWWTTTMANTKFGPSLTVTGNSIFPGGTSCELRANDSRRTGRSLRSSKGFWSYNVMVMSRLCWIAGLDDFLERITLLLWRYCTSSLSPFNSFLCNGNSLLNSNSSTGMILQAWYKLWRLELTSLFFYTTWVFYVGKYITKWIFFAILNSTILSSCGRNWLKVGLLNTVFKYLIGWRTKGIIVPVMISTIWW